MGCGISLDGTRIQKYGFAGMADISGIHHSGKRIEIEVKTGKAKQSKEQISFQQMIEKHNGIYILARNLKDAVDAILLVR